MGKSILCCLCHLAFDDHHYFFNVCYATRGRLLSFDPGRHVAPLVSGVCLFTPLVVEDIADPVIVFLRCDFHSGYFEVGRHSRQFPLPTFLLLFLEIRIA